MEKGEAIHLNNIQPPAPKDAKFGWNWFSGSGEDFLNFINVFSLFCYFLPFEKGGTLHLNKLESPSPKDALCQVWLKLSQWFLRRKCKCEKFMTRTPMKKTDKGQILIRKAHLSLQLRWAKKLHGFLEKCFSSSMVQTTL